MIAYFFRDFNYFFNITGANRVQHSSINQGHEPVLGLLGMLQYAPIPEKAGIAADRFVPGLTTFISMIYYIHIRDLLSS